MRESKFVAQWSANNKHMSAKEPQGSRDLLHSLPALRQLQLLQVTTQAVCQLGADRVSWEWRVLN